jgi:RNA polymerase sigma factor (sigma-70 family)
MWECIEDVDLRLDLEAASERLTDKQRQVVVLYLAGYTQAEIGVALGIARTSVRDHIAGAKGKFHEFVN